MNLKNKLKRRWRTLTSFRRGISYWDKARLFLAGLLAQIPLFIRGRSSFFEGVFRFLLIGVQAKSLDSIFVINSIGDLYHINPEYEKEIESWFNISEGDVFVDVGAHIGRYSLMLASKASVIIAFDPCYRTFGALVENIAVNKLENVFPLPFALWNKDGIEEFYIKRSAGSNTLKKWRYPKLTIRKEMVLTRTLDGLVDLLGIERVDLMKIDVEGAELEVLEGAYNTIVKFHPRLIIEVMNRNQIKVKEFLLNIGYSTIGAKSKKGYKNMLFKKFGEKGES